MSHADDTGLPDVQGHAQRRQYPPGLLQCLAGFPACAACDGDDHGNGGDDHGHAAEASFEFACTGEDADRAIDVLEGGNEGMILNKLPEANIDMKGPAVPPYFVPNPNNRQNGWVNLAVLTATSAGEHNATRNEDGWLKYNEADDEPGVGGYQPVLRYAAASPAGTRVARALAAAPLSPRNLPTESALDGYCAFASAVDALGNESTLPTARGTRAGTCNMAGAPDADAGTDTDNDANDATGYEMLLEALAIANRMDDDVAPATAKADATPIDKQQQPHCGARVPW